MMKKVLLLILALVMIPAAFSAADAAGTETERLFDLLDRSGENPLRIATAAPLADGIVVTAAALLPDDTEQLAVSDGEHTWAVKAVIPDETGSVATIFFDATEVPARFEGWPLLPYGGSVSASSCVVLCEDEEGNRKETGILSADEVFRQGRRFLVLTLAEPAGPGSAVLTADKQLAGIVTAEWAEGDNRVLALAPEEVASSLTGAVILLSNLRVWGERPDGLTVTLNRNQVTIDWKQMILPEKDEGVNLYMVVADTANSYLNYYPAETENREISLLLTPGRFYVAGIVAAAAAPEAFPAEYASFFIPYAKQVTEHGFRPVLTAVAEAPEISLKAGAEPVPVTEVTKDLLRSGRAYFYSHSTYEITGEERESRTLLITLTDPYGVNYRYESGWIYDPQYMTKDIWYLSLKDIGLTSMLDANGYPEGLYQLAFYIDGDLADMVTFVLR